MAFTDKVYGASLTESQFHTAMHAAMQRKSFDYRNGNGVAVGLSGSKTFYDAFSAAGPLISVLCRSGDMASGEVSVQGSQTSVRELLAQAGDRASQEEVLLQSVMKKIADMMMMSEGDLKPESKIVDLGLDSLVAVELRNWMVKEVAASVPVMDIVGCVTVKGLSDLVASRSGVMKSSS